MELEASWTTTLDVAPSAPPLPAGRRVGAGSRAPGQGLSRIEDAIEAIRAGELVIVVDDHDRENEGDFVMAADHVTPQTVNFMVTQGRGLVCLPMTGERCDALDLPPMVSEGAGEAETAFTLSIDVDDPDSTGISAHERARTIRAAIDPATRPADLRRPGHVFPLRARPDGVLERRGHTEASVDLARLAGCTPAGVICEIMNPDGTMARLADLLGVAERHGLHLITIADLVAYRRRHEVLVERAGEALLPTAHGDFRALGYRTAGGDEHVALVHGDLGDGSDVLVRVHSECLTGDALGSTRCDCGAQLDRAMAEIVAHGSGVVVYLRGHEGRGIGLVDKLRAYGLQDDGADTVEANLALGHPVDAREYHDAAQILTDLGVSSVRLLTNNPAKEQALVEHGVAVLARVPLETAPTRHNLHYLTTKRDKLGHTLRLGRQETA